MASDTSLPFRLQLENVSETVKQTKLERQRRHSDFVKRFNDIVTRHDRLKSGRLRRLSMDGIIVDFESLGRDRFDRKSPSWDSESLLASPRNRTPIDLKLATVARNETNNSLQLPQLPELNVKKVSNEDDAEDKPVIEKESQLSPRVTFKLELSFHCSSPTTGNVAKPKTRIVNDSYSRKQASVEPEAPTTKRGHRKLQRAYSKIVNMRSMAFMRRQNTVLSLASKDVCKSSELPKNPPYRREWSGNGVGLALNIDGQRPKQSAPPQPRLAFGRKRPEIDIQIETAKPTLHRAIQRVQTWKRFYER